MKKIKLTNIKPARVLLHIVLAAFAVVQIYPLIFLVFFSLKDNNEIYSGNVMGIPDQETPCGNSPTGVENRPPHQFRAQGILTDAVITGLIEFPECGGVFLGYGFELQHKTHIPCQNYEARVAAAGRPRERRAEQILMIENIFLEMGREFLDAGRKI